MITKSRKIRESMGIQCGNSRLCDYPATVPALPNRAGKLSPVWTQAHEPRIQRRMGIQG
ncbi:hypothetical protein KKF97_00215 [Myxococcota bacterium]|nr:hypothetical protein [Myxococcota bacterium]